MIRCYYPICLGIGLSLALATGVGASAAVDCGEPAPAPRTPEHPNLRTPERSWFLPGGVMTFYLIALAVVLLDQATKLLIIRTIQYGQAIAIIPDFFDIVFVLNPGAAFGFLATLSAGVRNPLFILVSVVAVVLIVFYRARYLGSNRLVSFALALVLGGAAGNLIDRLRYGMVVDFLDVHVGQYHWPAFNVADSTISIGVGLMILDIFLDWRREKRKG